MEESEKEKIRLNQVLKIRWKDWNMSENIKESWRNMSEWPWVGGSRKKTDWKLSCDLNRVPTWNFQCKCQRFLRAKKLKTYFISIINNDQE